MQQANVTLGTATEPPKAVRLSDVEIGTLFSAKFHKPDANPALVVRCGNGVLEFTGGKYMFFPYDEKSIGNTHLYEFKTLGKLVVSAE